MPDFLPEGIHDVSDAVYHADPCETPSASNSILKTIMTKSPLHARESHPRLNPNFEPIEANKSMNQGSAIHKIILGKGSDFIEVKFDDWRSKASKESRDAIKARGSIPLLTKDYDRAHECAERVIAQMKQHEECADFFAPGMSEAVAIWRRNGTLCRAMIDRLPDDPTAPVYDLKGSEKNISPVEWQRTFCNEYRTQERFYSLAMLALRGVMPPPARFVVFEMSAPYAVAVFTSAPALQHIATSQIDRALRMFQHCLDHDDWFGYRGTAHVEPPVWLERAFDDEKLNDEFTGFQI